MFLDKPDIFGAKKYLLKSIRYPNINISLHSEHTKYRTEMRDNLSTHPKIPYTI